MLLFSVITIPVAFIMLVLAVMIYKGKTELIHDYHQTKVTDKKGYGKAMGKALAVMAAGIFLSGITALFGDSDAIALTATVVLFAAVIAGFVCIYTVQKKYNGGMFGD